MNESGKYDCFAKCSTGWGYSLVSKLQVLSSFSTFERVYFGDLSLAKAISVLK